jgi:branched-chain amino acid transport system permease protein
MSQFIEHVIDALDLGSLYALYAIGIALIFGIMRLINFAHGELIVIGAYTLVWVGSQNLLLAIVVCLAATVVAALLMERVAFRPLRGADPSTMLITSFALSFGLQNLIIVTQGSLPKSVDLSPVFRQSWTVGSVTIGKLDVITILSTAALVGGLALFLSRSRLGVQMRASAENFGMARLLGVQANRVVAAAFAISGLLAGAASVLFIAQTGTVTASSGVTPVLYGFIATILGGLGSLVGAALGGLLLGVGSVVLQIALPDSLAPYRDAFLFGAVFLVLVLRPQGLVVSRSQAQRV